MKEYAAKCDFVVHLAGVNRPKDPSEFYDGNKGFTETLCHLLKEANNKCPIIISSSIQASRENDYGKSKKEGENLLLELSKENGNSIYIYRLANLFGKWCRPNYNSVTATWCYNIANDLDIQVNDENVVLPLVYIDDVITEIIKCMKGKATFDKENNYYTVLPIHYVRLGDMRDLLYSFKESRKNLIIPNQEDAFSKKLYSTYLSYLPKDKFSYPLKMNIDHRGSFTEFLKTSEYGQVSVNISKPGITKGEHWHHTKNEKFLVVSGKGLIEFRNIYSHEVIGYEVSGDKLEVIDIPTGYTHNIINLGILRWLLSCGQMKPLNPNKPDTYFEKVNN